MLKNHSFNTLKQAAEYLSERLSVQHDVDDIRQYLLDGKLIACFYSKSNNTHLFLSKGQTASIIKGVKGTYLCFYRSVQDVINQRSELIGGDREQLELIELKVSLDELERFSSCDRKPVVNRIIAEKLKDDVRKIESNSSANKANDVPKIIELIADSVVMVTFPEPGFERSKMPGTVEEFRRFCGEYSAWIGNMQTATFKDYCKSNKQRPFVWPRKTTSNSEYWREVSSRLDNQKSVI